MDDLEILDWGLANYPPGATYGPRSLASHAVVWILTGNVLITVDGRTHEALPGTVALLHPGQRDHYRWDTTHRTCHGYVHFHAHGLLAGHAIVRPLDRLGPVITELQTFLTRIDAGCEHAVLATSCLRTALLRLAVDDTESPWGPGHGHPAIDRLLAGLAQYWANGPALSLALPALAQLAGVSRAQLGRICHRELGCSPVAMLRNLRLERSARLLECSTLPLTAIAADAGFADPFHLSHAFRRRYGHSPQQHRQRDDVGRGTSDIFRSLAARLWHDEDHRKGTLR